MHNGLIHHGLSQGDASALSSFGGAVVTLLATPDGADAVIDTGFVSRLEQACDLHPQVPEMNKGRLTWLKDHLRTDYKVDLSLNSLSRYFKGIARPRRVAMNALAQLLGVDESWLALGVEPDHNPMQQRKRAVMADGAASVLAGFISMAGGAPAEAPPTVGRKVRIDLTAVIQRAQYQFHVALAAEADGKWRFQVPVIDEGVFVVGAIPEPGPCVAFVEIPHDWAMENGKVRGGVIEVDIDVAEMKAKRITDFGKRL